LGAKLLKVFEKTKDVLEKIRNFALTFTLE